MAIGQSIDIMSRNDALDFPGQPSISQLLTQLRRDTLRPHNRLASIRSDAEFVARVASAFCTRPLVANERCGSWYVPPAQRAASAYFKSTDGHERAWKFSTRRLNLHLLAMAEDKDGVIIVDSTRRGKRMPDALSTTIPIWCTVLSMALLPSHPLSSNLFLPPYLPPSVHSQIVALLPQFVSSFKALNLALPTTLTKPLRPYWVTQDSPLPSHEESDGVIFEDYRPVICCTASRRVTGSEVDQAGYVQGAGDDTENWALGLTPDVFWAHAEALLAAPEADLPRLIEALVEEHRAQQQAGGGGARRRVTRCISVCPLPVDADAGECLVVLTQGATPRETWTKSSTRMEVGLGRNKNASRNLRLALPDICDFARRYLQGRVEKGLEDGQLVVACESGKDVSVGAALALSCYLFDEGGRFCEPAEDAALSKAQIRVRLGGIMAAYPEANPSRATLQSVNSFLMERR